MNAMPESMETPQQAARRLSAHKLRDGYKPEALHGYPDATGKPIYWRIRLKHPGTHDKWIRPMHWDGSCYALGEPPAPPEGKPLYGLDRLAAEPDAAVYLVEGEACADALHMRGLVAVTSGGKDSADAADWTPLKGRTCIIWPDNDVPGMEYAQNVVRKLHNVAATVHLIAPEIVQSLPPKGDCVDWLHAHPEATADDVRALDTVQPEQGQDAMPTSEPEPLRRPLPPAEPYPVHALGDVLGDAVRRIHAVVQAPEAMCGQSVLAAASLAAQAHASVRIDGRREPLSLWHVTIGESGERKSAADAWALHAHKDHERTGIERFRQEQASHAVKLSAHEAAVRAASKGKDAGRIEAALLDVGPPPEPPLLPMLLVSEPTLEGVHKQLIAGQPSIGLFSDDGGDFLGGHAMNRDNRTKTAASLSKLWDDGSFDRVRAGDGAGKFYGRRVALHLMVQPIIAEAVLSDALLIGQGFLPRCLLAWPSSTIGTRRYVEADLSSDPGMVRYWSRMRALLEREPTVRHGTRNQLEPRDLTLTPEAKAYWTQVQDAIEADMGERGDFASARAWASKAGAQVLRIAGVLTLVEDPDAGVIHRPTIENAATLALYHLGEAVRIVGTSAVPAEVKHAEALLAWCHETRHTLLHSREALRLGPNCIRTRQVFDAAMQELERSGWAMPVEGGAVIDGKHRRRVWAIQRGA